MFEKERLDEALKQLGEIAEEKKAVIVEAFNKQLSEKELFEKLDVDENKFFAFIKALRREQEVFDQDVSEEELLAVAGGRKDENCTDSRTYDCAQVHFRKIYENGFPNCLSSVEDGSWCSEADACFAQAIEYVDMTDCSKSWE